VITVYVLKLQDLMVDADLLSVDTEGSEVEAIQTLGPYRPRIIIAEFWTQPNPPQPGPLKDACEAMGYTQVHQTEANLIFLHESASNLSRSH